MTGGISSRHAHQPGKAQICPLCVAPTMAIASAIADQNGGSRAAAGGWLTTLYDQRPSRGQNHAPRARAKGRAWWSGDVTHLMHVRSSEGLYLPSPLVLFPRFRVATPEGGHSPVGSDIFVYPFCQLCPEQRPAWSYEQPWMILAPGTASGVPNAGGARKGSQRVQPPSGVARPSQILLAGHGLSVRLSPTVTDARSRPGIS